jgi:uncharacterized membrane-anchored protein YitT (DUF2179 family)
MVRGGAVRLCLWCGAARDLPAWGESWGIGILALIVQDKPGFRAGRTQLIFDLCLFAAALFVLDLRTVAISFLGAIVVRLVISINHRRDWYIAT